VDQRVEAREFLASNKNEYAFASNRFHETANALQFVNDLYEAGAVRVEVGGILDEPERLAEEGGPYADTLYVELPSDTSARKAIFNLLQENDVDELDPPEGTGSSEVSAWWD
jgi:hypothetical protein